MAIKFNIEPYYDDFNTAGSDGLSPKEKYNRILFRPGHAVQARELTQIQSMLQHQVSSVGRHLFEEGSMVIPGHVSLESSLDAVKLTSINAADLDDLIGLTFTGSDTALQAKVVAVAPAAGTDPDTLYVKYQNTGSSDEKTFDDAETITSSTYSGVVETTTLGSVAFIEEGIYFVDNHFVVVKADQLILDKYGTDPSYDIGLEVTESIATSADDVSLNDNANGTPNYAAPGAHRYKISTKLVKQANEANTIEKFLLLLRVVDGEIIKKVRATEYSVLEETLARRTYDESGDYTVRPFVATVYEHETINTPGDETKLSVGLESGKAYVKGFELETLSTTYVNLDKARDSELFEAASVPMLIGNYVTIENVEGIPDIATFDKMEIRNATGGGGGIIGYARARSYVYQNSGQYRIYLFDIQMSSNYYFQDARSFRLAGTPEFVADIVLTNGNAIIQEPNRNSMVFKLPFDRVKTCDSQGDDVADDFNYVYFLNREVGSATVAAGEAVFNTVGANELFEPFDDENWILTIAIDSSGGSDTGTIVNLSSGDVTISGDSQTATISGLSSYNGDTVRLIAGVKRSLDHKTKSLTTSGADNVDLYPIATPSNTAWMQLGHADGYRLIAVYQSADTSTAATINDEDVTEYFDFDNGQRDNYYGISRVRVKPATAWKSSGQLLVKYEYFTHSGSGDFFTVDSYAGLEDTDGNPVEYENIPNFQSNSGEEIELRSAIDFRPRIDNSGGNFSGTGASVTVCPEPLTTFTTDVQYYLDRIDKIYLDKTGAFGSVTGVPSLTPSAPADPKDAMVLYQMFIPAYTLNPGEVEIRMIDNKRYTMRDIGKLEKRINSLEYYTSLSLLEKDAETRDIIDEATNTQRIKSGFVVDSFSSHSLGNVLSNEYRASIDRANRRLRAPFSEDNVRLLVNNSLSSNYQRTGDIITLPWTETSLANQNLASSYINVNPYEVFSWEGNITLSPTSDEWKDTTRRPDVIVNQDGVYDAMMSIIDATDAIGTQWNEWQTNWTGTEKTDNYTRTWGNGSRRGFGNRVGTAYDIRNVGTASRTGIETFVSPETINTDIGDRVVEINFAPFIRSRVISFKGTRMKPNTQVFAFFDGVDVSTFVREETDTWDNLRYGVLDNPVLNGKNTLTQHPNSPGTLTTDAKGEIIGSFFIPNNDSTFFKTGNREFKLTDSSSNNDSFATTFATANYSAKGLIETKENVTISTRVPTLETREVSDNKVVKSAWRQEIVPGSVSWYDPLAQSFIIPLEGGAFITGIDLYFHTRDENIPITLQIREMENGIPTQRVVPFSEVTLDAADVNVVDLTTSLPDSDLATEFNFESPVYLQDGTEYCFVLMANSNEYQVWYAEIGEDDYETGNRISKQPYAGVMFKSQNASTWTPDQNKDLKFKIKRCLFDTNVTGTVIFENGEIATRQLQKNPFATTDGSNVVRVSHKNHHFFENTNSIASYVTITGATEVNGIPASEINGTHEVDNIEMDSYTITVTTNATGTGIDGGTAVEATENQMYNTFYTNVQHFNLPGTNTGWGVKTSTGMSLGATSPTPYVTDSSFTPIIVNQNVNMAGPAVIAATDNEQSGKTFYLRGTLSSIRDNISPVIDLERVSVFTIANRIDNPIGTATIGYNTVEDYYPETDATLGSAKAKYVTKNIKLADAADGIRVFMDINRPSQTTVELYYRVSDNEEILDGLDWTQATAEEPIQYDDSGFYNESEFVIDPPGVFTFFAVKIVMKSTNSSRVPQVRDLRIIALQP